MLPDKTESGSSRSGIVGKILLNRSEVSAAVGHGGFRSQFALIGVRFNPAYLGELVPGQSGHS